MMTEFRYNDRSFSFAHLSEDHIAEWQRSAGSFYERQLLEAIASRRAEGAYVDVGAHVGNHTVFFASFCPSTAIHSFEPFPPLYQLLLRNLSANGVRAVAHAKAAADRACRATYTPGPVDNSGMGYITPGVGPVEAVTLDDTIRGERVAVIKIDCEGFEVPVLRGARRLITESRPLIAMEAATKPAFDAQSQMMAAHGYEPVARYCATPTYIWEPSPVRSALRLL